MASNRPSGTTIRHKNGYHAFLPAPLPPELGWTKKLVRSLSDADRILGQLAGEGGRLANPHLLLRPFIKREAVYSSRIEGTQATLGELLAAEAGGAVDRSSADLVEVGNYVVALDYGIKRLKTLPLSLRLVRELHEKLMQGSHGVHATPGEFRRSQNWIGPAGCTLATAAYVPPPPEHLMDCLGAWEKFLHDDSLPPLVHAALTHYQFEAIHPFLDGNGRVGRLLITLQLIQRNVLPAPLLYLSAFFEATRREYYDHLQNVRTHGDWSAWIQYFLNGVARQAEDALARTAQINKISDGWHRKIAGLAGAETLQQIIDSLQSNPFITVNETAKRLAAAFSTAQRHIDKLIDLRILKPVKEKKRNRVFCADQILKILEAPAKLTP